jgi:hypothetical protein
MKYKIYIAGKVTGVPIEVSTELFKNTCEYLRNKGNLVINPMELIKDPKTEWNSAMKICIRELLQCDALLLLDNWKESEGAKLEHQLAQILSIPIFTSAWTVNQFFKNR